MIVEKLDIQMMITLKEKRILVTLERVKNMSVSTQNTSVGTRNMSVGTRNTNVATKNTNVNTKKEMAKNENMEKYSMIVKN